MTRSFSTSVGLRSPEVARGEEASALADGGGLGLREVEALDFGSLSPKAAQLRYSFIQRVRGQFHLPFDGAEVFRNLARQIAQQQAQDKDTGFDCAERLAHIVHTAHEDIFCFAAVVGRMHDLRLRIALSIAHASSNGNDRFPAFFPRRSTL